MPRPAQKADLRAVADLYHQVWHETHAGFMPAEEAQLRSPAFFVERMERLLLTTLVVERDGLVAGFAAWTDGFLGQLYVERAHRGSGLAVTLLAEAERRMAQQGVATSELHCIMGNDRARRFYERSGWMHSRKAIEFVAGPNGPVEAGFWCMTKALIPTAPKSR